MENAPEPLSPSVGWNVIHLFVKARHGVETSAVQSAIDTATVEGCQTVVAAIVGHKADACVMATAEDLWSLRRLQTGLEAAGLEVVESYVSYLRRKIDTGEKRLLHTLRGVGYVLREPR